jgi:mono/diheme cytochrome c family protein
MRINRKYILSCLNKRYDLRSMWNLKPLLRLLLLVSMCAPISLFAQATPRLNSLFPAGGQVGKTVEVKIQGSDLDGAHTLIVEGDPGITGTLNTGGGEIDETHKPVFEANCGQCHELRSPSNRSMTATQWESVVKRMVREKGAEISEDDQTKIVHYLKSAARASGGMTAELVIAPDAPIGVRELRIVGKNGASTAWPFEITDVADTVETESNNLAESATAIELPIIINGAVNPGGDEDFFTFQGTKGDRCVFNVKAYRYNNISQQFFNPTISLFDAQGKELARSNGFYSLDPLIDFTLPEDGTYFLRIRDLLYRGNPDSVYRLTSGVVPYNTYIYPTGGTIGNVIKTTIGGENLPETEWEVKLPSDQQPGVTLIRTPYGIFPFIANEYVEDVERSLEETAHDQTANGEENETHARNAESEILFQTKCSACHELRSPNNRALTAEQWENTIIRMAEKDNADITTTERDRIIAFVAEEVVRMGQLIAKQIEGSQHIVTPGALSGRISKPGEVDYYQFTIEEGSRLGPWWVIHPFDNTDEKGFDTVFPPEVEIDLEKEYVGKDGRKIRWYKTNRRGENVFSNVPEDDVTGYALTYFESERDQKYLLSLGSDDTIKIWVNDQLIFTKYVHRPLRRGDDVIELPISKGRNKILFKITNGYGPWGFFADIGGYSIGLSAENLNSPLSPSLTLLNAEGRVLRNNAGRGGRRNAIIDYSFAQPGVYALRVEDITSKGGDGYVYHLDIRPTTPDFAISVTPDNPNIGRSGTVLLDVTLQRRVGFTEPILLSVENLPPGITASQSAILSEGGNEQGYLTLTAAPDAELAYSVVQVVGTVTTTSGHQIRRAATPVEVYRIRNNDQTVQRRNIVVSVTEASPIIVSATPDEIVVTPDGPVNVTIKVDRRKGNRQNINLTVVGLPTGVRLQRQTTVLRRNASEATLTLVPDIISSGTEELRQNPFIGNKQTRPYTFVVNASVGNRRIASSPAVKLWLGNPSTSDEQAKLEGN